MTAGRSLFWRCRSCRSHAARAAAGPAAPLRLCRLQRRRLPLTPLPLSECSRLGSHALHLSRAPQQERWPGSRRVLQGRGKLHSKLHDGRQHGGNWDLLDDWGAWDDQAAIGMSPSGAARQPQNALQAWGVPRCCWRTAAEKRVGDSSDGRAEPGGRSRELREAAAGRGGGGSSSSSKGTSRREARTPAGCSGGGRLRAATTWPSPTAARQVLMQSSSCHCDPLHVAWE